MKKKTVKIADYCVFLVLFAQSIYSGYSAKCSRMAHPGHGLDATSGQEHAEAGQEYAKVEHKHAEMEPKHAEAEHKYNAQGV